MQKKIFILVGMGLIILFITACSSLADLTGGSRKLPGKDVTVTMGQATWDTGWFQAQVYKLLLEELGYTVKETEPLNNVAFYIFTAQGDVDFWANGWFPLHDDYLNFEKVAGKVRPVGFQVEDGALQGYMVDKATAEELGITNLGDLKDPEIAAVFDKDGDGMADLIGCNTGWACETVIEHQLDEYELRDTVAHIQGDYSALMGETIARYEREEPVLFYTWTPNWTVSELVIGEDVMWLSVPFSSLPDEPDANTAVDSMVGCLETPCDTGFDVSDIRVVANVKFLGENPAASVLFENVIIPLNDIAAQNALMFAGENSEEDLRRHAAEWIEANREIVEQWLENARAAVK
jgi:glycine betaine/proline transport system substrate-binding protein